MIERMRKLSLLLYHAEKEPFLEKLRNLGVVHVVEDPDAQSAPLEGLREEIRDCERVVADLRRMAKGVPQTEVSRGPMAREKARELLATYSALVAERDRANQALMILRKEEAILAPWGELDVALIDALAAAGVRMRLYEVSVRAFAALDLGECAVELVARSRASVRFVAFGARDAVWPQAEAIILPARSLRQVRQLAEEERASIERAEERLRAMAGSVSSLSGYLNVLRSQATYESVRLSMASAAGDRLAVMRGWVPTKRVVDVDSFLAEFCAWYSFEEPGPGDVAPVKLVNPAFAKLFEPITKIFALPDYLELDPTPFFAPFFALFFGLCLGDLGYGLVLLVGAGVALVWARGKAPPVRGILWLLVVLGAFASISGVLLNTVFGHAIVDVPGSTGFLSSYASLAALSPVEGECGTTFPAMPFAVYLGVFQIMLGIVLNGVNRVRAQGAVFAFGPLAKLLLTAGVTVLMVRINFIDLRTFAFGMVRLGELIASLPAHTEWVLIGAGAALLLFLGSPDKKALPRFGKGVWDLYQFATGIMGDGLSYLRLFALGLAGGMLGAAFNDIAFMVIPARAVWYRPLLIGAAILILLAGHTINFALALLGSFVHSLRLTFVEFYKNLEFKGGGSAFTPFHTPTAE